MEFCTVRLVYILLVLSRVSTITVTPSPPTIESTSVQTTTSGNFTTGTTDEMEMPRVPLTEQVMDVNIRMSDVPDVDPESTDVPDSSLDRNRVIRDIAYYIRAHKFHDFDRRYYKSADQAAVRLYEDFPRPGLRSLHWEVRKHCDVSFFECLKYLERMVRLTTLKREDDTITVMRQRKWSPTNNTEQILATQRDCQMAQKRDDLTAAPFQGPIGKCIRDSPRRAVSNHIGTKSRHARSAHALVARTSFERVIQVSVDD
ncbi:hypothetical protein DMN91_000508 [Ooceraea biroi]|uniref:Uncharacterized protein n=1 Tax=Ooceraea biroi TaxID=2015173 RepID=A0A3L8E1V5_OOCBI|nr:hypothetical protein DMN91_000508 [Ooceraea biroi]